MEETKIWVRGIIIAFIVFVLALTICELDKKDKISEAIANGSNPIEAKLAFSCMEDTELVAIVQLMKEND